MNPTECKDEPCQMYGSDNDCHLPDSECPRKFFTQQCPRAINAAPPSPFVMVARGDLLTFKYMVESIVKHGQYAPQSGLIFPDLHDRLIQALETQPQAEG